MFVCNIKSSNTIFCTFLWFLILSYIFLITLLHLYSKIGSYCEQCAMCIVFGAQKCAVGTMTNLIYFDKICSIFDTANNEGVMTA